MKLSKLLVAIFLAATVFSLYACKKINRDCIVLPPEGNLLLHLAGTSANMNFWREPDTTTGVYYLGSSELLSQAQFDSIYSWLNISGSQPQSIVVYTDKFYMQGDIVQLKDVLAYSIIHVEGRTTRLSFYKLQDGLFQEIPAMNLRGGLDFNTRYWLAERFLMQPGDTVFAFDLWNPRNPRAGLSHENELYDLLSSWKAGQAK